MKPKNNYKPGPQDVMQTPPHAIEPLLPYLNREWIIWESAEGPEQLLSTALREQKFGVVSSGLPEHDYFEYEPPFWDIQITNVPFSLKYLWLKRAFGFRKRFAILVPYETSFAKDWQELFKQYNGNPWFIEKLSPERRINYKTPNKGWGVKEWDEQKQKMVSRGESAQMPTCWITWGLDIWKTRDDFLRTYYVPMRSVKYDENNQPIERKQRWG